MVTPEIEEFANLLMEHVRDRAISACDVSRRPDSNGPRAIRWREKKKASEIDTLIADMIPDCIDEALFYLLYAVDEGLLQLSFKSSSGKMVDLVEAGESEMAGWYAGGGPDGWRAIFSKERINDDLADLA